MAAEYTIICELRLRVGMRKQMHLFQNRNFDNASRENFRKQFSSNLFFFKLARFYSIKKLINFGGRRRRISYKIKVYELLVITIVIIVVFYAINYVN